MNDGRPWAMKIRNPDGSAIAETDADGNKVEQRPVKRAKTEKDGAPWKNRSPLRGIYKYP